MGQSEERATERIHLVAESREGLEGGSVVSDRLLTQLDGSELYGSIRTSRVRQEVIVDDGPCARRRPEP